MNFLIKTLEKTSTKRGLLTLTALYTLVFSLIIKTLYQLTEVSGGNGILDFDRGYSRERVIEVFSSYGDTGMALYARIQALDLVNPAIYSLLFASLTFLLWRNRKAVWVVIIPLVAGLLDYIENLTLYLLAQSYPTISADLVSISSTLSIIKNVALFGAILVLTLGVIFWLRNRFDS